MEFLTTVLWRVGANLTTTQSKCGLFHFRLLHIAVLYEPSPNKHTDSKLSYACEGHAFPESETSGAAASRCFLSYSYFGLSMREVLLISYAWEKVTLSIEILVESVSVELAIDDMTLERADGWRE